MINDGVSRAPIASCVQISDVRGLGLLAQGDPHDPASYPVLVPVDWQTAPTTVQLRRWANGDAELIAVNGVAPSPRALLPAAQVASPTRLGFGSVEFGCASVEAKCTVAYSAFQAGVVNVVVDAPLTITRIGAVADRKGDAAAGVTFTDADPQGSLSQYSGTIDWGDSIAATSSSSLGTRSVASRRAASIARQPGNLHGDHYDQRQRRREHDQEHDPRCCASLTLRAKHAFETERPPRPRPPGSMPPAKGGRARA